MAINQTGAIYKSLNFDGESSRTYGVYITGEAVYNAPEREVEMIAIPGRNGAFALDRGRFENIEVTYPAGIFADTEADFAEAISDFRNFLCSRSGYCRLTDEYNPDEYRLAVYKSGLEVSTSLLRAGEFEITFECKPQRFLTSGETPITVTSGDTITNPTLFDSNPMLEVYGYGNIEFNDAEVQIESRVMGSVKLGEIPYLKQNIVPNNTYTFDYTIDGSLLNGGDGISVNALDVKINYAITNFNWSFDNTLIYTQSGTSFDFITYDGLTYTYSYEGIVGYKFNNMSFAKGTSKTYTRTTNFKIQMSNSTNEYMQITVALSYDGNETFTLSVSVPANSGHSESRYITINDANNNKSVYGNSSISVLGNPLYIDCELGIAYKREGDSVVSVNDAVSLPSELPTIAPGENAFTYSNTISSIDVIPRWWKI